MLAGVVSAYGVFAIVAAIAGAVLTSIDVNTEFRTNDWTGSGAVAALTSALVLFLAYLFGGYVAGRMARRAGTLHGVMVFVVSLVIGAVAGGVVSTLADSNDVERNLRSIGMPTTTDQITDVALVGIIVSLAAVLVGAVLGGHLGERWHTKLARRVADPEIGTTAEERARLDEEQAERRDRIARDDAFDAGSPRPGPRPPRQRRSAGGRRGSLHRGGVAGRASPPTPKSTSDDDLRD